MPKGGYWKNDELSFLKENAMIMCPKELAEHLPNRDAMAVRKKLNREDIPHKHETEYTEDEKLFIEDNWGVKSIKWIAKEMGKPQNAVDVYARKVLKLGSARDNVLEFRASQIAEAMGIDRNVVYKWYKTYELPMRNKLICKERKTLIIDSNKLMKWLEAHQDKFKAHFELYALGEEPLWLKEKRKHDTVCKDREPYTPQQIANAVRQWHRGRKIDDIATEYGRTSSKGLREAMNRYIKNTMQSR
jgi:hypothetical protein